MTGTTQDDTMLFSAQGPITSAVSTDCSQTLRSSTQLSVGGRILLFGAFVELAQNIARHSAARDPDGNVGIGTISVERTDSGFALRTTNLVDENQAADLERRLAEIRAIPRDQLNRHYLAQLHRTEPSVARSGLGLIDLHRKAVSQPTIDLSPTKSGQFSLGIHLCIVCA